MKGVKLRFIYPPFFAPEWNGGARSRSARIVSSTQFCKIVQGKALQNWEEEAMVDCSQANNALRKSVIDSDEGP